MKLDAWLIEVGMTESHSLFNSYYFSHCCGRPYERDEWWLAFFDRIAERIVADFQPSSVLDAGCGLGFLVEALRRRRVEAYGLDVSEFAIQNVHESVREYCWQGSIGDALPRRYDLIVTIEVFEHLRQPDAEAAIANLSRFTDRILFSSTPTDYAEASHFNVQPPEYWAALFARQGMLRDMAIDAGYVTPWAACFVRRPVPLWQLVAGYERQLWQRRQDADAQRDVNLRQRQELSQLEEAKGKLASAASSGLVTEDQHEADLQVVRESLRQEMENERRRLAEQQAEFESRARELAADRERARLDSDNAHRRMAEQRAEFESRARELAADRERARLDSDNAHRRMAEQQRQIEFATREVAALQQRQAQLEASFGWVMLRRLQNLRAAVAPPASSRDHVVDNVLQGFLRRDPARFVRAARIIGTDLRHRASSIPRKTSPPSPPLTAGEGHAQRPPVQPHTATVDIVVCVHNAPEYVHQCLESVVQRTQVPYRLIIVDDASNAETQLMLDGFAANQPGTIVIRNEAARGYTRAANQGLHRSDADFVVLLNSDTIVTFGWLDRLIACAESDPRIGITGPLSNTASWQSIPAIQSNGDWAPNPLPGGTTVVDMGNLVANRSARLYPYMPFLNGFCLLIKHQLIEAIGYFDEETFGAGYGEENDYCLRARKAGWQLALADDAYVFHAQGKSYTDERRIQLCKHADLALVKKHGTELIQTGMHYCRYDRVLQGIRARSQVMMEQSDMLQRGRKQFSGSRILFLLPVLDAGGGGALVAGIAKKMNEMGVRADVFNLAGFRQGFELGYPNFPVPVIYGTAEDIAELGIQYDAVVATIHSSVAWLAPLANVKPSVVLGYFVQDFEPYFYMPYSTEYKAALASYTHFPNLARITTTEWIRRQVYLHADVDCTPIGVGIDPKLFLPLPRNEEWPNRPLRLAAMVRPETPRRAPAFTVEVMKQVAAEAGPAIDIWLFGAAADDPAYLSLKPEFAHHFAGKLDRTQIPKFLNDMDVFVDLSDYQALGLTALEAMACGVVPIVPVTGGASTFARNGKNCLATDTSSRDASLATIRELVTNHALRARLQQQGINDASTFHLEGLSYRMLVSLFGTPT